MMPSSLLYGSIYGDRPKKRKIKRKKQAKKRKKKGPGGPRIQRGKSETEVGTPDDFKRAVEKKFGKIMFDLAASARLKLVKTNKYYSKADDAFSYKWSNNGKKLQWLNPPYNNIGPWANKCLGESIDGAQILFLVPASVGSNWYRDNIHGLADVYFLHGRIIFKGSKTPYPKDCMLVHFYRGAGLQAPHVWEWRKGSHSGSWNWREGSDHLAAFFRHLGESVARDVMGQKGLSESGAIGGDRTSRN